MLSYNTFMGLSMKIRIIYTKLGEIRFVSHLDIIRIISRALRRAEAPVMLSCGFNPHFLVSYGSPISLGIESICETADIVLKKDCDILKIKDDLNNVLPPGINIEKIMELKDGSPSLLDLEFYFEYEFYLEHVDSDWIQERIKVFNTSGIELKINKKNKETLLKINDFISKIEFSINNENRLTLRARISSGNGGVRLSPFNFIKAFMGFEKKEELGAAIKKVDFAREKTL